MDSTDIIMGPEALQISLRLNCPCESGINWMQIVDASAGSGSFTNMVSGSRFECPTCHRQISVELIVQSRYDRPPT